MQPGATAAPGVVTQPGANVMVGNMLEPSDLVPLGQEQGLFTSENTVGTDNPIMDFDAKVLEMMQRNPQMPRLTAVQQVAKQNPQLHEAFLLATNGHSSKARRQITEKYEIEREKAAAN